MTSPEDEPLFSSQTSGKPRPRLVYITTWCMYDKISLPSSYLLDWPATRISDTERTDLFPRFRQELVFVVFSFGGPRTVHRLVKRIPVRDMASDPVAQHQPRFTRPPQRIKKFPVFTCAEQTSVLTKAMVNAVPENGRRKRRFRQVFILVTLVPVHPLVKQPRDRPSVKFCDRSWRRLEMHLMLLLDRVMERGGVRMKSSRESQDRMVTRWSGRTLYL
ncbi:uncharacterized protein BT62DRAFT_1013650 [Guyanagaster necrorhizus]|uniref:Uncharacterized protein n=1 Tax=Guyanagaster necrorhizus TaxID=856835 RepID=A0A9P7VFL7_9AGAR|nr:uncharacterized protein BT62DRAFT_1013650 [Guyanagaster necrorhizus MCA 3950]KAG7439682.1 hypothetical protein BT62DRAFT_1013650 [Guyanagaster necrorhizus MCA 3950]